jgi:hypothetical protein
VPRWAGNVAVLAAVYFAVMSAAALWMPHEWDWSVFQWLSARVAPAFSPEVSIVDLDWDPSDIPSNRRRVAAFLDGLVASGKRPFAVLIDIEFDPCQSKPCGAPMESARSTLLASIHAATAKFPVFALEQPSVDRNDDEVAPLDPRDARIYAELSGAAHTRFTLIPKSDGLWYRVCYANVPFADEAGKVEGVQSVWSMVARALMTPRVFASSPACDTSHVPLRMGTKLAAGAPVFSHFTDARTFSGYSQLDDRSYVIVGTTKYDRPPFTDRSGPELLAWALSNALDQGSLAGRGSYYDSQPQNAMLLLLVPAFSGLVVVAFMAIFYQLKRSRLQRLRRFLPWISAGIAALFGLAVLVAFEMWLLASHHIQPQVSLISLGIVVAAGLCGLRGFAIVLDEANAIDPGAGESYDYDVFISYAHEEGAWVYEHVYVPFRDAALPDGKKLSIFFDTSSIRAGTGWQTKLSLAIDGSRFIVPVYSDTYFTKPYCRFEILRAHRKWIQAGDQSRCVLPVMRGHPTIYATVNDIQALSLDDYSDLVQQHVAEVVERLSRIS